ncbi:hypothetical protein B6V74_05790 [Thioclava sp. F42-5]|uniref:GYD domain-containing protein n=1 Tax=Thioclava sp. F42-5 TaxID=1973005 RepID=UPI000B540C0E|nr:GYD domain-containing protein [Thioclava sp. F42-5]OWY09532.1 hypothetical protein B6V74_05790 [Thioclava sp. F42-5]
MGRFVITGSFSPQAIKGFMDSPTDRWETIDALIKAAGGKLESYYITTGPSDFLIIATGDDMKKVLPAIMAAAGSGSLSKVQTQEAFTTADFKEMQKAAAGIRSNFVPPGS